MTFEEWWNNEMTMTFTSKKQKADAMAIANRAWNVAIREMAKQKEKSLPLTTCMFCGGKYFHTETCKLSPYQPTR